MSWSLGSFIFFDVTFQKNAVTCYFSFLCGRVEGRSYIMFYFYNLLFVFCFGSFFYICQYTVTIFPELCSDLVGK